MVPVEPLYQKSYLFGTIDYLKFFFTLLTYFSRETIKVLGKVQFMKSYFCAASV